MDNLWIWFVVGIATPLKNMSSSIGMMKLLNENVKNSCSSHHQPPTGFQQSFWGGVRKHPQFVETLGLGLWDETYKVYVANFSNFSCRSCSDQLLLFIVFGNSYQFRQLQSTCWLLNGGNFRLINKSVGKGCLHPGSLCSHAPKTNWR